jgi:hypothetical protein
MEYNINRTGINTFNLVFGTEYGFEYKVTQLVAPLYTETLVTLTTELTNCTVSDSTFGKELIDFIMN